MKQEAIPTLLLNKPAESARVLGQIGQNLIARFYSREIENALWEMPSSERLQNTAQQTTKAEASNLGLE